VNVTKLLKSFGIEFSEMHHSLSSKCIGIDCPYCFDKDKHLGIFIEGGNFSCWKCGTRGNFVTLIHKLTGLPFSEINKHLERYTPTGESQAILTTIFEPKKSIESKVNWNGLKVSNTLSHYLVEKFCQERDYSIEILFKYGCMYSPTGLYSQRLIIPIPHLSELIAFTARDLTGLNEKKYLFPPGFKAHKTIYLTSEPDISKNLFVVEGVFDAWAIQESGVGIGCAIFGKELSKFQLGKIISLSVKQIYIMLDSDTKRQTLKTTEMIRGFKSAIPIYLEQGDPDSNKNQLSKIIERII
jgi:5S rRNA maturation endonuclease (ribonuclease M5)